MKKYINHFLDNAEKWSNIFNSMFDHFSALRRKWLNYNFQEYFKGIIPNILCKTLTLTILKTLQ